MLVTVRGLPYAARRRPGSRARRFRVVTGGRLHGVDSKLAPEETEPVSGRWTYSRIGRFGADVSCSDRARILRPPSLNHKTEPPAAVRLVACAPQRRYELDDITRELPWPCSPAGMPRSDEMRAITDDPLLAVAPATYVELLAGLRVPPSGKVACPFHQDDTPSLHVYDEPDRGWYCYGCRRGGSVYDFASLMWCVTARGCDFVELRERLIAVLTGDSSELLRQGLGGL